VEFCVNAWILPSRSWRYTRRTNARAYTLGKRAHRTVVHLRISLLPCFIECVRDVVQPWPRHVHDQLAGGSTPHRVDFATTGRFIFRHEKLAVALEPKCTIQIVFLRTRYYYSWTDLSFEPTLGPFGVACRAIFVLTPWKLVFNNILLAWAWDESFVTGQIVFEHVVHLVTGCAEIESCTVVAH